MKFPYKGKSYEFSLDTLTFDEGEIIEDYARLDVPDFIDALKRVKMRAIRAALYIAMRRAGEEPKWGDLGSVDMMALGQAIADANRDPDEQPVEAGEGVAAVASPDAAPVAKLKAARKPKTVKAPALEPEPAQAG